MSGRVAGSVAVSLRAGRGLLGGQHGADREHARQDVDRLLGRLAQRLEPGGARRLDLEREGDMAVAHGEAGNHAEADDIAAALAVAHAAQRVEDLLLANGADA